MRAHTRIRHYLAFAVVVLVLIINSESGLAAKREFEQEPSPKPQPEAAAQPCPDPSVTVQMEKSLKKLASQMETLAKRVGDLEKERLFDVTRVLLVGEEQRAETLQGRLRESIERQILLQARLELVDNQLRPESIERLFVGIGSVRPEEAREAVRRRLSVEKQGIVAQLELVRQERNRFQAALASADMTIQRLRMRLAEAGRP